MPGPIWKLSSNSGDISRRITHLVEDPTDTERNTLGEPTMASLQTLLERGLAQGPTTHDFDFWLGPALDQCPSPPFKRTPLSETPVPKSVTKSVTESVTESVAKSVTKSVPPSKTKSVQKSVPPATPGLACPCPCSARPCPCPAEAQLLQGTGDFLGATKEDRDNHVIPSTQNEARQAPHTTSMPTHHDTKRHVLKPDPNAFHETLKCCVWWVVGDR